MNHIKSLDIKTFRGIKNLSIDNLGDVNILLGSNNSGKTSVLEAIEILSQPENFNNIVLVSRQRELFRSPSMNQSPLMNFSNLFDKSSDELCIEMRYCTNQNQRGMLLTGEMVKSLPSLEEIERLRFAPGQKVESIQEESIQEEVDTFEGRLRYSVFSESRDISRDSKIVFNKFSRITLSLKNKPLFSCEFMSTIDHLVKNRLSAVIRNKDLTDETVSLLQKVFDSDIQDIRLLEDADGRQYYAIEHKKLGYMPISTFGDGIKKVLAIASAIALAKNGVLLIDEFETALHTKDMASVYGFMVTAAKEKNVQLFLTTHSLEALETLMHSNQMSLSEMRIITLYQKESRSVARVLNGIQALNLHNELGLELR